MLFLLLLLGSLLLLLLLLFGSLLLLSSLENESTSVSEEKGTFIPHYELSLTLSFISSSFNFFSSCLRRASYWLQNKSTTYTNLLLLLTLLLIHQSTDLLSLFLCKLSTNEDTLSI